MDNEAEKISGNDKESNIKDNGDDIKEWKKSDGDGEVHWNKNGTNHYASSNLE